MHPRDIEWKSLKTQECGSFATFASLSMLAGVSHPLLLTPKFSLPEEDENVLNVVCQ